MFPDNVNFMDLEASALYNGYPIQVGIAGTKRNYSSLIIPHEEWNDLNWDYNSQDIHGFEKSTLYSKGENIIHVAKKINSLFKDEIIYVEQNFDIMWIQQLFEYAEIPIEFKLKILFEDFKEFEDHWNWAVYQVSQSHKFKRHDALEDAKLFQKSYQFIKKHF